MIQLYVVNKKSTTNITLTCYDKRIKMQSIINQNKSEVNINFRQIILQVKKFFQR